MIQTTISPPPYLFDFQQFATDAIIGGYTTFGSRAETVAPSGCLISNSDEKTNLLNRDFEQLYLRTPWGKAFRRKVIESNNLYFRAGMRLGEDTEFVLKFFSVCHSIILIPTTSYAYNMRSEWTHSYHLTAQEYNRYLSDLEVALYQIAAPEKLEDCRDKLRGMFYTIFKICMWNNGMEFARTNARDWCSLHMWRFLPDCSHFNKVRASIVMLLWPILYRNLISRNSR